ncbi:MAG: prepilin-type N-terminal cleavage/methylation domain-containing protein [Gammaproteobacteria bacterium]|nr:prepilin-type N-terminal cleavage/methylation domain-containing protein [Gammaproteobacteria bacterium]
MNRIPAIKNQHGLTLVEVMISITISLILLAGILQIFVGTKQTYRVQEAISRIQENGRFAMDFLARNARMADFWGCNRDMSNFNNLLNPVSAGYIDFMGGGVDGTDNTGLNGSDTLIIRGAIGSGIMVETPYMNTNAANIKVNANNGLQQNDVVAISDCKMGDIFQITNANPNTSGTVVHNTGTGSIGNATKNLSTVYQGDAQIYIARQYSYQIAAGNSGEPALFRSTNGVNEELVDGIENMQIIYGEDTDGDGSANYYVSAGSVVDMNNVVSVRISLMVRNPDDKITDAGRTYSYMGNTFSAPDQRLRKIFTTTITIRNRV